MAENTNREVSTTSLILIPALISLAITILRLVGELQHWSETFFNPKPGGPGSIVGIAWLAPIFGIYFAIKLSNSGQGSLSPGKGILMVILGVVLVVVVLIIASKTLPQTSPATLLVIAVALVVAAFLQQRPWPALFKALLLYGLAARIPVAIVMLIAINKGWGTHYDVAPPNFPETSWFMKWVLIGAIPQFLMWIPFTIISGTLFGQITAALRGKSSAPTPTTA